MPYLRKNNLKYKKESKTRTCISQNCLKSLLKTRKILIHFSVLEGLTINKGTISGDIPIKILKQHRATPKNWEIFLMSLSRWQIF